jgi:hypothetical protein
MSCRQHWPAYEITTDPTRFMELHDPDVYAAGKDNALRQDNTC